MKTSVLNIKIDPKVKRDAQKVALEKTPITRSYTTIRWKANGLGAGVSTLPATFALFLKK